MYAPISYSSHLLGALLLKASKNPANPNSVDQYGHTPLHYAAYEGLTDLLKLLLDKGASPVVADQDGYLPLHKAIWKGKEKCAEILLAQKAQQKAIDYPSKLYVRFSDWL